MLCKSRIVVVGFLLLFLAVAAGCQHRLVAARGESSVTIYPDEDTYRKIRDLKNKSGLEGMLGGLGENFAGKKVDDQTPVTVLSSDTLGSMVEVSGGPNKGLKGFVPKTSVD